MDPLEQKIRDLFQEIPFGDQGGSLLDHEVIYSLDIEGDQADCVLVIPQEHLKKQTEKAVEKALQSLEEIKQVKIRTMRSTKGLEERQAPQRPQGPGGPPQGPRKTSYFSNYDNVIVVASGKGGVGKSTVSLNLALALKALGKTVSLFDADIYGPSVPIMMGLREARPEVVGNKMLPLSKFGIEFLSIGNLVNEDDSMVWRGPMVHHAIEQLMRDAEWPGGEYMIMDLPPGTGDVQLSLSQLTEVLGAIIVCTPQDVALLDARKAVGMFSKVDIPIIGIIENMSSFICPKCGEETPIFSKGGAEKEGELQQIPFIGRVPIELAIREGGDSGNPIVAAAPQSESAKIFLEMANTLNQAVEAID